MGKKKEFENRNEKFIKAMTNDKYLKELSKAWFLASHQYEYSYHFTWLGRPIIQFPQDIVTVQELIWKIKPDLIIETGIAHGGSLILSASILELIGNGEILGIDLDIKKHNKIAIEKHPLYHRITMIEGSSIDKKVVNKVFQFAKNKKRILLILDSNHSQAHVTKELKLYSPLVTKGGYILVFDTIIEDMPKNWLNEHGIKRPWNKNDNPKTAVWEFLKKNHRFKIDRKYQNKSLITTAPDGFLKCVKN